MNNLILVRHGQSFWNKERKFTGFVDIELTEQGKSEARHAGQLIKGLNIEFDACFTSVLKRAINSLNIILEVLDKPNVEIIKAWELNERHYGELTGLNKDEMKKVYGKKKIQIFRRSWNVAPAPLDKNNPYHPINIKIYKEISLEKIPSTESLKNVYNRVLPYFKNNIEKLLNNNKNVIISAHGNSLRALCKSLFNLSKTNIRKLEIPTGNPLLIKFEDKLKINNCYYLDQSRSKDLLIKF